MGRWFLLVCVLAALGLAGWGHRLVRGQGLATDGPRTLPTGRVTFDRHAVPTLEAEDWPQMVEAQGYVTAGLRFFQMDLMRRSARGRLAELVPAALPLDKRRHAQDFEGAATFMADALPAGERALCDRYADGVNAFLREHEDRVSLEYRLLGVAPAPWECRDTLAIALSMAEQLASDEHLERQRRVWHEHLPADWYAFLFPEDHPDNLPLFGTPRPPPPWPRTLPAAAAAPAPGSAPAPELPGSNAWLVSRGPSARFVANDPHLGANVPHLWLFVRLYFGPDRWVVGVSIPGVPGVVLGMNPVLAWAFTNVGEDVDDLVEETLDVSGTRYVDRVDGSGRPVYASVEVRRHEIRVRGEGTKVVESRHTRRGPLLEIDGRFYSRMWLPLQRDPRIARLWTTALADARNLEAADRAIDGFRVPAQNVLVLDRAGNMLYRASGTGVVRTGPGRFPLPAGERTFRGLAPVDERPRACFPKGSRPFLVTANQRIWVDDVGHDFASDRRAARIREVLRSLRAPTAADMAALQLDTHSSYHLAVVRFVTAHAPPAGPREEAARRVLADWPGDALGHEAAYAMARTAERAIFDDLLGRVKAAYLPRERWRVGYPGRMRDAWIRRVLAAPEELARFGTTAEELAGRALARAAAGPRGYIVENRFQAQHPFVGRVPLLGRLFRVPEYAQWGDSDLVRVERPRFGASLRVVWDLADPDASRWITPVGQSGHLGAHYADLLPRFHRDLRLPVFDAVHRYDAQIPHRGCDGHLRAHIGK